MTNELRRDDELSFDLADRMRKTLRVRKIGVAEMAEHLGVVRATVGSWINGKTKPSEQTLLLWAHKTEVPYQWLCSGVFPSQDCSDQKHN